MRPPEGVANALAASEIQYVEPQLLEPIIGLKQGSTGVSSGIELGEEEREEGSLYTNFILERNFADILTRCSSLLLP